MSNASLTTSLKRYDHTLGPRIVSPADGKLVDLGSIGARMMSWAEETGGGFSLVEHPMPPKHLAAPIHRHSREDEYSYVLEGTMGAVLGDDVVYAEAGDLPDFAPSRLGEIGARYGLEFKPESVRKLCEEHGLVHPLSQAG